MSSLEKQVGGDHYKKLKIQPIEFIIANNLTYPEGCVVKYICRWKDKNGIEDLEKIIHYVEIMIEEESAKTEEQVKVYTFKVYTISCNSCFKVSTVNNYQTRCPKCGSTNVRIVF